MKKIIVILLIFSAGRVAAQSNVEQRPPVKEGGAQTLSVSSVGVQQQLPIKGGVQTRGTSTSSVAKQVAPIKTGGAASSSVATQLDSVLPIKTSAANAAAASPAVAIPMRSSDNSEKKP